MLLYNILPAGYVALRRCVLEGEGLTTQCTRMTFYPDIFLSSFKLEVLDFHSFHAYEKQFGIE